MFTHKRCKQKDTELLEGVANARFGYCDVCGNQGTIYWVLGSGREYRVKQAGVQYIGHLDRAELVLAGGAKGEPKEFPDSPREKDSDPYKHARSIEKAENFTSTDEPQEWLDQLDGSEKPSETPTEAIVNGVMELAETVGKALGVIEDSPVTEADKTEVTESIAEVEEETEEAGEEEAQTEAQAKEEAKSKPVDDEAPSDDTPPEPVEKTKPIEEMTQEELLARLKEIEGK